MKRKNLILGIAATALIIGVAAFNATPVLAHGPHGYGGYYGQMGPGFSQGMMNQGHRMMGMGNGMTGFGLGPCNQSAGSNVDRNLGVDDVKGFMENRLEMMGNDRLKVGKVEASGENSIVVEIVTIDDSLVRKIVFDTKTGAHRPI